MSDALSALIVHCAEHRAQALVVFIALWTATYGLVEALLAARGFSFDFKNRVVSVIHAVLSLVLAVPLVVMRPYTIGATNTDEQTFVLLVSTGYFIYDFIAVTYVELTHKKIDFAGFGHHMATLSGLLYGVFSNQNAAELGLALALMEVSNPFMHSIHLLREMKMADSSLAMANQGLFALVFFVARIIIGPVLVYYTLASSTTHIIVKIGAVGILAVSVFWLSKIYKMAMKVLFPKKDKKEKTKDQ